MGGRACEVDIKRALLKALEKERKDWESVEASLIRHSFGVGIFHAPHLTHSIVMGFTHGIRVKKMNGEKRVRTLSLRGSKR